MSDELHETRDIDYRSYGLKRWLWHKKYCPAEYVRAFFWGFALAETLLVSSVSLLLMQNLFEQPVAAIYFTSVVFAIAGFCLIVFQPLIWLPLRRLRRGVKVNAGLICFRCSYFLSEQPEGNCPECNTPFHRALLQEAWGRLFGHIFAPSDDPGDHLRRPMIRAYSLRPHEFHRFVAREGL